MLVRCCGLAPAPCPAGRAPTGPRLLTRPPIPALCAAKLEPLVGATLARILFVLVRVGFLVSISTIFPMQAGGATDAV